MESRAIATESQPRVAVVTINWNGKADTLACLESLRADTYANKEVVVIDNGSSDDSVTTIRSHFPEVTIFEAGKNLGFTGGNNLGLRHAGDTGAKYVYWLNNDTTSEPDAISRLVEAAEAEPNVAMWTPLIHYFDNPAQPWFAGSLIDLRRGIAVHDNSNPPQPGAPSRDVPWVSGCAMFGRTDVLRELGGFDDRYFLNWEDVDLCLRIREAGYGLRLVPAARIYHKVGKTFATLSNVGLYYHVRNNLLLIRTHRGGWLAATRVILEGLGNPGRNWRLGLFGSARALRVTIRAICDHMLKRYGHATL
jgi:GT2 family glycosyltransferase